MQTQVVLQGFLLMHPCRLHSSAVKAHHQFHRALGKPAWLLPLSAMHSSLARCKLMHHASLFCAELLRCKSIEGLPSADVGVCQIHDYGAVAKILPCQPPASSKFCILYHALVVLPLRERIVLCGSSSIAELSLYLAVVATPSYRSRRTLMARSSLLMSSLTAMRFCPASHFASPTPPC